MVEDNEFVEGIKVVVLTVVGSATTVVVCSILVVVFAVKNNVDGIVVNGVSVVYNQNNLGNFNYMLFTSLSRCEQFEKLRQAILLEHNPTLGQVD